MSVDKVLQKVVSNIGDIDTRLKKLEEAERLRRLDLQSQLPATLSGVTLTLGQGNAFVVSSGGNPIHFIDPAGWTPGSEISLEFFSQCLLVSSSPLVGSAPILLQSDANYFAFGGDILHFQYTNGTWREISRVSYSQAGPWSRIIAETMALPGLVGFWPGNVLGAAGQLNDLSHNAIHATPTGSPVMETIINHLWGWQDSRVAGLKYHTVPNTAVIDITGAETWVGNGNKGLTIGAVFFPVSAGDPVLLSKWSDLASAERAYQLRRGSGGGPFEFHLSVDGTTDAYVSHSATYSLNNFYHVYGRFRAITTTGPRMDIFVNGVREGTLTGVAPATIASSPRDLILGAEETAAATFANEIHGFTGMWFVCVAGVPDEYLIALFDAQRGVTGV